MIVSEFETLRADLATFRADMTAKISGIETEIATLRAAIDAKPDTATIYQALLSVGVTMFTVVAGTAVLLKTIS